MKLQFKSDLLRPPRRIVEGIDLERYMYRWYKSRGYGGVVNNVLANKEMKINSVLIMRFVANMRLEVLKNIPISVMPKSWRVIGIKKNHIILEIDDE